MGKHRDKSRDRATGSISSSAGGKHGSKQKGESTAYGYDYEYYMGAQQKAKVSYRFV